MAMSYTLTYKEEIEALQEREEGNFEAKGDALYMYHADDAARFEWAFYRPSGSHPDQVRDKNVMVSIMAFNHSRLGALERFSRVHRKVIEGRLWTEEPHKIPASVDCHAPHTSREQYLLRAAPGELE